MRGGEGRRQGEVQKCRVEGVKMNLGSYHPINKLSVIWNSDSETDTETGCASLIFTPPPFALQLPLKKGL